MVLRLIKSIFLLTVTLAHVTVAQTFTSNVYGISEGFDLAHINTTAVDSSGFLWIIGETSDIARSRFQSNSHKIMRLDGYEFTSIDLELPYNLHPRTDDVIVTKNGNFIFQVSGIDNSNNHYIQFNPYNYKFSLHPIVPDSLKQVVNFFTSNLLAKNDSIYLSAWDHGNVYLYAFDQNMGMNAKRRLDQRLNLAPATGFNSFRIGCESEIMISGYDGKYIYTESGRIKLHDCLIDNSVANNPNFTHFELTSYIKNEDLDKLGGCTFGLGTRVLEQTNDHCGNINQVDQPLPFNRLPNIRTYFANDTLIGLKLDALGDKIVFSIPGSKPYDYLYYIEDLDLLLHFDGDNLIVYHINTDRIQNYLKGSSIRKIVPYDDDQYLVSTEINGLYLLNPETEELKDFQFHKQDQKKYRENRLVFNYYDTWYVNDLTTIFKIDQNQNDWIESRLGFYSSDAIINYGDFIISQWGEIHKYNLVDGTLSVGPSLPNVWNTDAVVSTVDSTIFSVGDHGLYKADWKDLERISIYYDPDDPFLICISEIRENEFLIGSSKGNIYQFIADKGKMAKVFDDPIDAGIASILRDDNGEFWISTFNGLLNLDEDFNILFRYSELDGMSHYEGNRYSLYQDGNRIFTGTIDGLNVFDPKDLLNSDSESKWFLKSASYYVKDTLVRKISPVDMQGLSAFRLPVESKLLRLEFGFVNVELFNKVKFQYRLNGGKWTDMDDYAKLSFDNLQSGHYDLDVRLVNMSNYPMGQPKRFTIFAPYFFYQTLWFRALIGLVSIGIILAILARSRKMKRIQQEFSSRLIEMQDQERKRISRELHDSASQELVLLKNHTDQLGDQKGSQLSASVLASIREISHGLHPNILEKQGLTSSIQQLIRKVDEVSDIFVVGEVDDISNIYAPEKELHIYRFIQEAVGNVLKHAEARTLKLFIEKGSKMVHVRVQDNGKGFDVKADGVKKSLGLSTMRERAHILNAGYTTFSEPDKGTSVELTIPIPG